MKAAASQNVMLYFSSGFCGLGKSIQISECIESIVFRGSEFSSYKIELRNRVTQNDVTDVFSKVYRVMA